MSQPGHKPSTRRNVANAKNLYLLAVKQEAENGSPDRAQTVAAEQVAAHFSPEIMARVLTDLRDGTGI